MKLYYLTVSKLLPFARVYFQIQLSRPVPSSPTGEEQVIVVPILHDVQENTTQQADIPRQAPTAGTPLSVSSSHPHFAIVNATLRRWSEVNPRTGK